MQGHEDSFFASTSNGKEALFCITNPYGIAYFRMLLPKKTSKANESIQTIADYKASGERVGISVEGIMISGEKEELAKFFSTHTLCALAFLKNQPTLRDKVDQIDLLLTHQDLSIITVDLDKITSEKPLNAIDLDINDYLALKKDIAATDMPFEFALSNYAIDTSGSGLNHVRQYGQNCARKALPKAINTIQATETTNVIRSSSGNFSTNKTSIPTNDFSPKLLTSMPPKSKLIDSSISLRMQKHGHFFRSGRQEIIVSFIDGPLKGKAVYSDNFTPNNDTISVIWSTLKSELKKHGFIRSATSITNDEIWIYGDK